MTALRFLDTPETQTVGAIAATLPGATEVFRRFRIDFCCGGATTLTEAARAKGVPVADITAALAALAAAQGASAPEETGALIEHIVLRYHETHRREMPELISLAQRVEARHADHPQNPQGLVRLLKTMAVAMEDHMAKEEMVLFPMMRAGGNPMIGHPIACMRHEHDEHGDKLAALDDLTRHRALPDDACTTWRALYAGIDKFVADLTEHVHLENNVLFPRFEERRNA